MATDFNSTDTAGLNGPILSQSDLTWQAKLRPCYGLLTFTKKNQAFNPFISSIDIVWLTQIQDIWTLAQITECGYSYRSAKPPLVGSADLIEGNPIPCRVPTFG